MDQFTQMLKADGGSDFFPGETFRVLKGPRSLLKRAGSYQPQNLD
jgi:hypothetical protein